MHPFLYFQLFLLSVVLPLSAATFTVVIDPGHGGERKKGVNDGTDHSHGASYNNATGKTAKGTVLEKNLTLEYAEALAVELRKLPDTEVFLTRENDVSISAMQRAALAVEKQADVFISLHFNGGGGHGARAYVVAEDHARWEFMHFTNPYWKRDAALGNKLVTTLDKTFAPFGGKASKTKVFNDTRFPTKANGLGAGNLKDGIRVLGYARMDPHLYNAAVVLLEIEFLDNPKIANWLVTEKARGAYARDVAKSLQAWHLDGAKKFRVTAPLKSSGR